MTKKIVPEIRSLCNGTVVSLSPVRKEDIVPLFCPLCEFPMKTSDDSIAYGQCETCDKCKNKWENVLNVNLKEKVYPDKTSELWKEYIDLRAFQARPIFKFS